MRIRSVRFAACFLIAVVSCGFVIPASAAAQGIPSSQASPTDDDFSGTVDIGNGRKLFLECHGEGSPAVILESGLRTRGDNWGRADLLTHGGAPRSAGGGEVRARLHL